MTRSSRTFASRSVASSRIADSRSPPSRRCSARVMSKTAPSAVSLQDFEDWRRASRPFSGMSLILINPVNFSADDHASDQYEGAYISSEGFSLIGARATQTPRIKIAQRCSPNRCAVLYSPRPPLDRKVAPHEKDSGISSILCGGIPRMSIDA
jgi:hypothetical protein